MPKLDSRTLPELASAYEAIQSILESQVHAESEQEMDAFIDQLHEIGWQASGQRAVSPVDLRAKATMLADLFAESQNDLSGVLATSICQDIFELFGSGNSKDGTGKLPEPQKRSSKK